MTFIVGFLCLGIVLMVIFAIAQLTRYRFSSQERGFIKFVLKEAEASKVEKGNMPGFYFKNFKRLQIAYVESSQDKKPLYLANPMEIRAEILGSYKG